MKTRIALLASLVSFCLVAVVSAQVSTTTGTVVSNSGGTLVVETDSGQRTFMVDAQSSVPADLAAGAKVTVEYHTLANDKLHAFKVTTTGSSPTTKASMPSTTTTAPASPLAEPVAPAEPSPMAAAPTTPSTSMDQPSTTTTTTTDTTAPADTTTSNERRPLPATASPLPLLALAGSLALAGGVLLRRRRA